MSDRDRKQVCLAEPVLTQAAGLLEPGERFRFYINPFEAIGLGGVRPGTEPDRRVIRRAKRLFLHEVECDGKAAELDGLPIDLSQAHAICDVLDDPAAPRFRYHLAIYRAKPLLRFLTRGDIECFLCAEDDCQQSPLDTPDDPRFQEFVSEPFARQYNLVLGRAIERRAVPAVEALLNGSRWIQPEHEEIGFECAARQLDYLEPVS